MASFPLHNVIHIDEEIEPLNAFDQAACDRVLDLFGMPYGNLSKAQIVMLEKIVASTKNAKIPFNHVFKPEDILWEDEMNDMPLNDLPPNWVDPACVPFDKIAPYLKTTKAQWKTGHTVTDSIADQMRGIWKTFCEGRGDAEDHIYTRDDVLEFVQFTDLFVDDPELGIPLVSLRGKEWHIKYNNDQQCFMQITVGHSYRLCLTPGCFRSEGSNFSPGFENCSRHYDTEVHVVLEISRPDTNYPHRHVQFQLTIDTDWNNNKIRAYLEQLWQVHKQTYSPNVSSSVTEAWIFDNYQDAVEKIACLQFCHILRAMHDTTHEYVSDYVKLPINLQDRIGPILTQLGISITLNGTVSVEELETIGLSDLFGVEFSEEMLQESSIVLYRYANEHLEYRGLSTDWTKKKMLITDPTKSLLFACTERGQKFTYEPRRILADKIGMEKAEFLTILGSGIMAYLHAPRPDTRQDFVNVNVLANASFLRNRQPVNDQLHVPVEMYESNDDHEDDYNCDDESAFYDNEHLTDLELLTQWIANEYRVKVIITVNDVEEQDEEYLAFVGAD